MKYLKFLSVIVLAVTMMAACGNRSDTDSIQNGQDTTATESQAMNEENVMQDTESIVALASENQDLSTFTQALNAADRVQMLKNQGPYTVFAPTNDAFDALPEGTLENLMKSENVSKLTNILAYHVVKGTMTAADLEDGQILTTVQGGTLKVAKKDGNVTINGAQVSKADEQASNGVLHVVDKVLMPTN